MTVAKIFLNAPPEFSWGMFCYLPPSFSQGSCCGEDFTVQKAVLKDNRGRGKSALLSMGHLTPTTAFNHKQWEIAIHFFAKVDNDHFDRQILLCEGLWAYVFGKKLDLL